MLETESGGDQILLLVFVRKAGEGLESGAQRAVVVASGTHHGRVSQGIGRHA